jgi:hypothetical protein
MSTVIASICPAQISRLGGRLICFLANGRKRTGNTPGMHGCIRVLIIARCRREETFV